MLAIMSLILTSLMLYSAVILCTGIAQGHGSKSHTGLNFFRPYFHYCSSSAHYCKDHFHSPLQSCLARCGKHLIVCFCGPSPMFMQNVVPRIKTSELWNKYHEQIACISLSFPSIVAASGYDVDPRLHGNSSGYHSDDASPIKKSEGAPFQEFRMPGMLDSHDDHSRKIVQPSDVVIMVLLFKIVKKQISKWF